MTQKFPSTDRLAVNLHYHAWDIDGTPRFLMHRLHGPYVGPEHLNLSIAWRVNMSVLVNGLGVTMLWNPSVTWCEFIVKCGRLWPAAFVESRSRATTSRSSRAFLYR